MFGDVDENGVDGVVDLLPSVATINACTVGCSGGFTVVGGAVAAVAVTFAALPVLATDGGRVGLGSGDLDGVDPISRRRRRCKFTACPWLRERR